MGSMVWPWITLDLVGVTWNFWWYWKFSSLATYMRAHASRNQQSRELLTFQNAFKKLLTTPPLYFFAVLSITNIHMCQILCISDHWKWHVHHGTATYPSDTKANFKDPGRYFSFKISKKRVRTGRPSCTGIEGQFRWFGVSPWSTRWDFGLQTFTRGGPYECARSFFSDFWLRTRVDRNCAKSS